MLFMSTKNYFLPLRHNTAQIWEIQDGGSPIKIKKNSLQDRSPRLECSYRSTPLSSHWTLPLNAEYKFQANQDIKVVG